MGWDLTNNGKLPWDGKNNGQLPMTSLWVGTGQTMVSCH